MKMQLINILGIGRLGVSTRKGMVALADQAVVSSTNFLTGVIIGRACTKEEFGLYMLGFSIVFFMTALQDSLISTPYLVYSRRLKGNALAEYTGSTLIHQLAFSALAILVLVVVIMVLSLGVGPQGLAQVAGALAFTITFILLREYVRRICFADLRMKSVFLIDSYVSIVQIGGLLLLAYTGLLSASRALAVIGIACGIVAIGWIIANQKAFAPRINQAISDLGHNLSFGKWVFGGALVWVLTTQLYPWILVAFHGSASAGVWAACFGIVAFANPVRLGLQNFLGPKIVNVYATHDTGALRQYVFKATIIYVAIALPLFLTIMVFGGMLVTIVYGGKYAGNSIVVSGLAIDFLVTVVAFSFSRALFAMERPDLNFWGNCVGLFVLLTIGLWLTKSFGAAGAAFALLLGNLLALALRYVHYSRCVSSITIKE